MCFITPYRKLEAQTSDMIESGGPRKPWNQEPSSGCPSTKTARHWGPYNCRGSGKRGCTTSQYMGIFWIHTSLRWSGTQLTLQHLKNPTHSNKTWQTHSKNQACSLTGGLQKMLPARGPHMCAQAQSFETGRSDQRFTCQTQLENCAVNPWLSCDYYMVIEVYDDELTMVILWLLWWIIHGYFT